MRSISFQNLDGTSPRKYICCVRGIINLLENILNFWRMKDVHMTSFDNQNCANKLNKKRVRILKFSDYEFKALGDSELESSRLSSRHFI